MIAALIALWGSIWFRRAVLLAGVLGVLFVARSHYISIGKQQGHAEAAIQEQISSEQQRIQARAELTKVLDDSAAQLETANRRFEQARQLVAAQQDVILRLQGQRVQQAKEVAQIPDSNLHEYVVHNLGLRPIADLKAGYYPIEERAIADCLTQRPLCEQQQTALSKEVSGQAEQLRNVNVKLDAIQKQAQGVTAYANSVEHLYVELYNAFPRKRNWFLTIITLGIAGKPKALGMPEPIELQRRRELLYGVKGTE